MSIKFKLLFTEFHKYLFLIFCFHFLRTLNMRSIPKLYCWFLSSLIKKTIFGIGLPTDLLREPHATPRGDSWFLHRQWRNDSVYFNWSCKCLNSSTFNQNGLKEYRNVWKKKFEISLLHKIAGNVSDKLSKLKITFRP